QLVKRNDDRTLPHQQPLPQNRTLAATRAPRRSPPVPATVASPEMRRTSYESATLSITTNRRADTATGATTAARARRLARASHVQVRPYAGQTLPPHLRHGVRLRVGHPGVGVPRLLPRRGGPTTHAASRDLPVHGVPQAART